MYETLVHNKSPFILRTVPVIRFTDDQLYDFCQINRELKIEKNTQGNLLIMSPTGGESGWRNTQILTSLNIWANKDGSGVVFDSSTGFVLPNGSMRSPDAAWVSRSRLSVLTKEQKRKFIPLCPDFVIEILSFSDSLKELQEKMEEYMKNDARLGWLIAPESRMLYIYRSGEEKESVCNPGMVSAEPLLPGFVFDFSEIWETGF